MGYISRDKTLSSCMILILKTLSWNHLHQCLFIKLLRSFNIGKVLDNQWGIPGNSSMYCSSVKPCVCIMSSSISCSSQFEQQAILAAIWCSAKKSSCEIDPFCRTPQWCHFVCKRYKKTQYQQSVQKTFWNKYGCNNQWHTLIQGKVDCHNMNIQERGLKGLIWEGRLICDIIPLLHP